jgi:hypothetical protein
MKTNGYKLVDLLEIEQFNDDTSIVNASILADTRSLTITISNDTMKRTLYILCFVVIMFLFLILMFVISYIMSDNYYVETKAIDFNVIQNSNSITYTGYIARQSLLFGENITCIDKYDLPNNIISERFALNYIQSKLKSDYIKYKYVNPILNSCYDDPFVLNILIKICLAIMYILIGICVYIGMFCSSNNDD